MKQALCLVAIFFLLTAAKENTMSASTYATPKNSNVATGASAAMPDPQTIALLSDPGFQALFGKGGIFDGTKDEVTNRISAIETMTKLGPVLQDPNFVATMQAMSKNPPPGTTAPAATTATPRRRQTTQQAY